MYRKKELLHEQREWTIQILELNLRIRNSPELRCRHVEQLWKEKAKAARLRMSYDLHFSAITQHKFGAGPKILDLLSLIGPQNTNPLHDLLSPVA
jgi:hypothetical protein